MRAILTNDINDSETVQKIREEISEDKNFLYITVAKNIADLRADTPELSAFFRKGKEENLFSLQRLTQMCTQRVYAKNRFLSNGDQRYILDKLFQWYFRKTPKLARMYSSIKYKLFELYDFLLFTDTPPVSQEVLTLIDENHSIREKEIFELYNYFYQIVQDIANGDKSDLIAACGLHLNLRRRNIHTFRNQVKAELLRILVQYDKIIMDGFVISSDEYPNYIIKSAKEKKIDLLMILKDICNFKEKPYFEFLSEADCGVTYLNRPLVSCPPMTSLDYLKQNFGKSVSKSEGFANDSSVIVMPPFRNRDREFRFIAEGISERIQQHCGDKSEEEIFRFVHNEIAIVLVANRLKYQRRLDAVFREIGVFVYKNDMSEAMDETSFRPLYYRRSDFLNDHPAYRNGRRLNYEEKMVFFKKHFRRLGLEQADRPIISYPVIQYVLALYSCIKDGMSVQQFRLLLYSDWDYVVCNSDEQYDRYLADFDILSAFFEDKSDIKSWIQLIDHILEQRPNMLNDYLYKYHPFCTVSEQSLEFFLNFLYSLSEVMETLSTVKGSIIQHFQALSENVLQLRQLQSMPEEERTLEQAVVIRLIGIVREITSGSIVENLEFNYFAENLTALLEDYTQETEDMNVIPVNHVHLLNLRSYPYVWFPVCESDKYPRAFGDSFPYTEPILDVLQNPLYKINRSPGGTKTLHDFITFEHRILKNVLDFSGEQIIVTYSEKEAGDLKNPSVFIEDIYTTLNCDKTPVESLPIHLPPRHTLAERELPNALYSKMRSAYSVTELLTYKLCPKLFYYRYEAHRNQVPYQSQYHLRLYAEAILYCDAVRRLAQKSDAEDKVYAAADNEICIDASRCLADSLTENLPFFDFLSQYQIRDMKNRVLQRMIQYFLNNAVKYKKFDHYLVSALHPQSVDCRDYSAFLEFDTRISGYGVNDKEPKDRSIVRQNRNYIDFLVLKSNYNVIGTDKTHYGEMMECLDQNPRGLDRLGLILTMQRKINVQFDCGVPRYKQDGMKRLDDLIGLVRKADLLAPACISSSFCPYCSLQDVCKEN